MENEYPWMKIARTKLGVSETGSFRDQEFIKHCLAGTTVGHPFDLTVKTPWCSAFVNEMVEESGFKGTDSAAAASWLAWGREPEGDQDWKPGVIVIFARVGGNHVALLLDWDDDAKTVTVLGGNQSDCVCIRTRSMDDVIGYRVPA